MIKGWIRDLTLAVQSKSGVSSAVLVGMAIVAFASLVAFVFLCVAGYSWLAEEYGNVAAGLAMAGLFILVALIAALASHIARRRTRERAILARAAHAHAPSWLLDPRLLAAGIQAGRALGWQRIVPIVLLGFMAAQWARENRAASQQQSD
jgi:hypothetical protein